MARGDVVGRRYPCFTGFDRGEFPETPASPGTRWLQLLFRTSTLRITGAYFNHANWVPRLTTLQQDGWGIAAIFFGLSRLTFQHKESRPVIDKTTGKQVIDKNGKFVTRKVLVPLTPAETIARDATMTATRGTADAISARATALKAGLRPGSIVWMDAEDDNFTSYAQTEIDYYSAFFTELASAANGQAAFRPGVYAHLATAAQLLVSHPEVHIWSTDYVDASDVPQVLNQFPNDPRYGIDPTAKACAIRAFSVVPGGGVSSWTAWPLVRQLFGNSPVQIPPRQIRGLAPLINWDLDSALVRDPVSAFATPRLTACTIGSTSFVWRVDDLDPHIDPSSGQADLPRRGRLRLYPPPFRTATDVAGAGVNLDPATPVVPLTADVAEVVVLSVTGAPCSATLQNNKWSPLAPLWAQAIAPPPRFPFAIAGCQTSQMKYLFFAATTGELRAAQRSGTKAWDAPATAGGKLKLHPFGAIRACTRGTTVHAVTFNDSGVPVEVRWNTSDKTWPATAYTAISQAPALPYSIAAAAPSPNELVVVVVGTDHRPWRYVLRGPSGKEQWTAAAALGHPEDVITTHSSLALTVVSATTLDLIAMGGDGVPQRYTLLQKDDWTAASRTPLITPDFGKGGTPVNPKSDAVLPNPHGDLSSTRAGSAAVPLVAFTAVAAGQVAGLVSLQTGTSIRLID